MRGWREAEVLGRGVEAVFSYVAFGKAEDEKESTAIVSPTMPIAAPSDEKCGERKLAQGAMLRPASEA